MVGILNRAQATPVARGGIGIDLRPAQRMLMDGLDTIYSKEYVGSLPAVWGDHNGTDNHSDWPTGGGNDDTIGDIARADASGASQGSSAGSATGIPGASVAGAIVWGCVASAASAVDALL